MIADAFRCHGYRVREVGGRGRAEGGMDVVLDCVGESKIAQAKHWRRDRVGVSLVRELYGVQRAMWAQHSMFVAMGSHTGDATQFAAQVGMTLVNGEELLRIIGTGFHGESLELPTPTAVSAPRVQRAERRWSGGPPAGAACRARFLGVLYLSALPRDGPILDEVPLVR